MGERGWGWRLTECGFDHTNLHSCSIEAGERAPVVYDETGSYYIGTTVYCASLEMSRFRLQSFGQ